MYVVCLKSESYTMNKKDIVNERTESVTDLHDLSVFVGEVSRPEDVCTGGDAAALVWLLEEP